MAEFNTEDYLDGMEDADKLAEQAAASEPEATPAEPAKVTEEPADAEAPADAEDDSLTPLGKAKAEAAEYLDALQRERAAFVNFRNRTAKEQDKHREHGVVDVLTALLPALDDIDRIRQNSEIDDSFAAVAAKIDKTFEKFGVEKFGEAGEAFDPTRHEGILRKPDADVTEETVDTVVEAGYKIGDRIIRAARVVVAVPQD
ncbi:nucleotide exchange factor GrpE [Alloscardovia macacae]|uniref:Protein GrpE n=1 Tax=Alloscardovia macacae TaxID=1160091 RepID=A0A261F028_9BIFI|nr:nucleotide exchange factor GrpE [Alloscardovia macacae]OZG52474.1 nucleotide exchange factor GrpE [Alloscardovia macacae]